MEHITLQRLGCSFSLLPVCLMHRWALAPLLCKGESDVVVETWLDCVTLITSCVSHCSTNFTIAGNTNFGVAIPSKPAASYFCCSRDCQVQCHWMTDNTRSRTIEYHLAYSDPERGLLSQRQELCIPALLTCALLCFCFRPQCLTRQPPPAICGHSLALIYPNDIHYGYDLLLPHSLWLWYALCFSCALLCPTTLWFLFSQAAFLANQNEYNFTVPPPAPPARIFVVGANGSGKGGVCEELSKEFGLHYISLKKGEWRIVSVIIG